MATKRRSTSKQRRSHKRDLVKAKSATHFAKRGQRGQFKQMDERGRAAASDRRRASKTKSRSGYGARGDGVA